MARKLKIERHVPIEMGEVNQVVLVLAGCGGTGSFLALHVGRLAWHLRETRGLTPEIHLVDPDVVEAKNIGRQNFCAAEIGQPKARALATRYSRAFGLAITAWVEPFKRLKIQIPGVTALHGRTLGILLGCVDNAAARREMHEALRFNPNLWWMDGGNHQWAGQVLLGNRTDIQKPRLSKLGFCEALPAPGVQAPDLLEDPPLAEVEPRSCADLALADTQSLMVNQAVAGWMATYLSRLILSRDLDMYATRFDLLAGSARSDYIVGRS